MPSKKKKFDANTSFSEILITYSNWPFANVNMREKKAYNLNVVVIERTRLFSRKAQMQIFLSAEKLKTLSEKRKKNIVSKII